MTSLNEDVLTEILRFLSLRELYSASRVSSLWFRASTILPIKLAIRASNSKELEQLSECHLNITSLSIEQNFSNSDALTKLFSSNCCRNLLELELRNIKLLDEDILTRLTSLQTLEVFSAGSDLKVLSLIASSTVLKNLKSLSLHGCFEEDIIDTLANNPSFSNLTLLKMKSSASISEEKLVNPLISGKFVTNLSELEVSSCSSECTTSIPSSINFKNLRKLTVGNLSTKGIESVFRSPFLKELKQLSFESNRGEIDTRLVIDNVSHIYSLDMEGKVTIFEDSSKVNNLTSLSGKVFLELAKNPFLPSLTSLKTKDSCTSYEGILEFFTHPNLTNLKMIEIHNLGEEECSSLIANAQLSQLKELSLCSSFVRDSSLRNLNCKYLTKLSLFNCNIGDSGAFMLANHKLLSNLEYLDLTANKLTSKGVAVIATSEYLKKLKELALSNNEIGFDGFGILLGGNMENLECLDLEDAGLSDNCILLLCAKPTLQNLTQLNIGYNEKITEEVITYLLLKPPKLKRLRHLTLPNCSIPSENLVNTPLGQQLFSIDYGNMDLADEYM